MGMVFYLRFDEENGSKAGLGKSFLYNLCIDLTKQLKSVLSNEDIEYLKSIYVPREPEGLIEMESEKLLNIFLKLKSSLLSKDKLSFYMIKEIDSADIGNDITNKSGFSLSNLAHFVYKDEEFIISGDWNFCILSPKKDYDDEKFSKARFDSLARKKLLENKRIKDLTKEKKAVLGKNEYQIISKSFYEFYKREIEASIKILQTSLKNKKKLFLEWN